MRFKPFGVAFFLGMCSLNLPAQTLITGKYGKNDRAFVEVLEKQENSFSFAVNVSLNSGACAFRGTAKNIDARRAGAVYNDCFLVFSFDETYQKLTLNSKGCVKTCQGDAQQLVDGVYSK